MDEKENFEDAAAGGTEGESRVGRRIQALLSEIQGQVSQPSGSDHYESFYRRQADVNQALESYDKDALVTALKQLEAVSNGSRTTLGTIRSLVEEIQAMPELTSADLR